MKALPEGLYIKHFQRGLDVVTESNTERTSIDFDLQGLKRFLTSLTVVELPNEMPPKRPGMKRRKKTVAPTAPAL